MAHILSCEIVTPDAKLFSDEALLVSAPAAEGEIGMMYQCSPLMSTLRRGTVRIKSDNDELTTFIVDGGYLETDGRKVVVLASRAIDLAKVDKSVSSERIAENEKRLAGLDESDPARTFVEGEISWQNYLISQL